MLIEGADATARGLLDDLFTAASTEEMEAAFEELRAEMDYRTAQTEEYERKHRQHSGGPRHTRRVAPGALDAVVAEWETITGGPAEPDEGDV